MLQSIHNYLSSIYNFTGLLKINKYSSCRLKYHTVIVSPMQKWQGGDLRNIPLGSLQFGFEQSMAYFKFNYKINHSKSTEEHDLNSSLTLVNKSNLHLQWY